jgi:tetratricopeptide (TPR) repeat protein
MLQGISWVSVGAEMLSRYKNFERLGQGGMGEVYRAEDVDLQRPVALKFLTREAFAEEHLRVRLLREARTAAALNHPNVCTIYEVGEVGSGEEQTLGAEHPVAAGTPYIAMELVEGRPLNEILDESGALPVERLLRIAAQIADGMAAAHARGIVHRDLKPANVMVSGDERVKILDFGLAKPVKEADRRDRVMTAAETISEELTAEGRVLGTVAYMSPEQAMGKPVDLRSDIFSFGTMLYEMAAGDRPFRGETSVSTLAKILEAEPAPMQESGLPPELKRIVSRCLRKKPEERYNDTRDLVVALKDLRQETTSGAVPRVHSDADETASAPVAAPRGPAQAGARATRWILPAVAAIVVIAALAIIGTRILSDRSASGLAGDGPASLAVLAFQNLRDADDSDRVGQILQELIITDLSDLPSLDVFSSQRLRDVHKQLRVENVADESMGVEVARRAGASAMLTGSLSQLGEQWILTGQLIDVASGKVIASERIDGDDLYAMADFLTEKLREDLRLTTAGASGLDVSVREKTTSSLEAYRHYVAGEELLNSQEWDAAVSELEKAIEIDPEFAAAHYKLAIASWWADEDEYDERAIEILSRLVAAEFPVSRKLELLVEGSLYQVRRQYADALPIFERAVQEFPDEKEAWYALGEARYHYPGGGKRADSRAAFEKAIELDPSFKLPYAHLFQLYEDKQDHDIAIARARALVAEEPGHPAWRGALVSALVSAGAETADEEIDEAIRAVIEPEGRRRILIEAATAYRMSFDSPKAEELLERARDVDPDAPDVTTLAGLGWNAIAQRRSREAENYFLEARDLAPTHIGVLSGLGQAYLNQNLYPEAMAVADELAKAHPESIQRHDLWFSTAVQTGNEEEMAAAWDSATRLGLLEVDPVSAQLRVANIFFDVWDFVRVERHAREALSAAAGDHRARALNMLGWGLAFQGKDEEAERSFLEGLAIAERERMTEQAILNGLSQLSLEQGRYAIAYDYRRRYIDLLPSGYPQWGTSLLIAIEDARGRTVEADALLGKALSNLEQIEQKRELLIMTTLTCQLPTGQLDTAESLLDRAEALDPEARDAGWLMARAWLFGLRGQYAEAEDALRKALAVGPSERWHEDHASMKRMLAATLLGRGRHAEAERILREQLEAGPVHSSAYRQLGLVLAEQGRFDEARPLAEKAVSMNPNYDATNVLAWILVAGKLDIDAGIETALRALSLPMRTYFYPSPQDPYVPCPEHTLGRAYLELGERDKAVEYLETALDKRPNRPSIREDLQRARGDGS